MPPSFRVVYWTKDGSIQGTQTFVRTPIRIGRNALNDLQIVRPYVSDFHASIEFVDGQVCVRDLFSRNGIYAMNGERIAPDAPFFFVGRAGAFVIAKRVNVTIDLVAQSSDIGERLSKTRGTVLGNRSALASLPPRTPVYPAAHDRNGARSVPSLPALDDARAPGRPVAAGPFVAQPNGPLDPAMAMSLPSLTPVTSDRQRPHDAADAGACGHARAPFRSTQQFSMPLETLAMIGLRELAASLVPDVPLETTGDVARLLTKLHDTVEVFCRSLVPLRQGYCQFVSPFDLQRAASQRSLNRSSSALRVEHAQDPAAVASALLDWRNQDYDAPGAVEGILADLVIHHVALVEAVMRGLSSMLDELDPANIERMFEERPASLGAVFGRYRALWRSFRNRHDELASRAHAFEVIFGREFAATYRDYVARQRDATAGRPSAQ